jgi:hypothetical protein
VSWRPGSDIRILSRRPREANAKSAQDFLRHRCPADGFMTRRTIGAAEAARTIGPERRPTTTRIIAR